MNFVTNVFRKYINKNEDTHPPPGKRDQVLPQEEITPPSRPKELQCVERGKKKKSDEEEPFEDASETTPSLNNEESIKDIVRPLTPTEGLDEAKKDLEIVDVDKSSKSLVADENAASKSLKIDAPDSLNGTIAVGSLECIRSPEGLKDNSEAKTLLVPPQELKQEAGSLGNQNFIVECNSPEPNELLNSVEAVKKQVNEKPNNTESLDNIVTSPPKQNARPITVEKLKPDITSSNAEGRDGKRDIKASKNEVTHSIEKGIKPEESVGPKVNNLPTGNGEKAEICKVDIREKKLASSEKGSPREANELLLDTIPIVDTSINTLTTSNNGQNVETVNRNIVELVNPTQLSLARENGPKDNSPRVGVEKIELHLNSHKTVPESSEQILKEANHNTTNADFQRIEIKDHESPVDDKGNNLDELNKRDTLDKSKESIGDISIKLGDSSSIDQKPQQNTTDADSQRIDIKDYESPDFAKHNKLDELNKLDKDKLKESIGDVSIMLGETSVRALQRQDTREFEKIEKQLQKEEMEMQKRKNHAAANSNIIDEDEELSILDHDLEKPFDGKLSFKRQETREFERLEKQFAKEAGNETSNKIDNILDQLVEESNSAQCTDKTTIKTNITNEDILDQLIEACNKSATSEIEDTEKIKTLDLVDPTTLIDTEKIPDDLISETFNKQDQVAVHKTCYVDGIDSGIPQVETKNTLFKQNENESRLGNLHDGKEPSHKLHKDSVNNGDKGAVDPSTVCLGETEESKEPLCTENSLTSDPNNHSENSNQGCRPKTPNITKKPYKAKEKANQLAKPWKTNVKATKNKAEVRPTVRCTPTSYTEQSSLSTLEQNNAESTETKEALKQKVISLQQELDNLKKSKTEENICGSLTSTNISDSDIASKYITLLGEYEKRIAFQSSELDRMKRDEEKCLRHFTNTEMAFSDVFEKYEKAKIVIAAYRKNEDVLVENIEMAEEQVIALENKCATMKEQCMEQIRRAQEQLIYEKEKYKQDVAKLQAQVKRLEINASSLELALKQKNEECRALAALCDDITGRTSN